MTEIVLIRHGETDWNREEIFRGHADIPLNKTGLRQAGLLSQHLSGKKLEAVVSSPLKRALVTTEIIARPHGIAPEVADGLIDFDYGRWQGLSHADVKEKYSAQYSRWLTSPHLVRIPDGERLNDVRKRALPVIANIVERFPNGIVAIVSHRVVLKVLICALLGIGDKNFWNIQIDNCGVTTFVHDGGRFILTSHNDMSFLKTLEKTSSRDF